MTIGNIVARNAMQYPESEVLVFGDEPDVIVNPDDYYIFLCTGGTAAASFPADLKKAVQAHFPNAGLYYTYGLTESSGGNATVLDPARIYDKDGSIGLVSPILNYRIVDETGGDVKPGDPGELLLKGPSVISGYYKRDEETQKTFVDGWLHTGDVVSRDEEGVNIMRVPGRNMAWLLKKLHA